MAKLLSNRTFNIPLQTGLVLLSEMVRQNAIAQLCDCRPGWITEKKKAVSSISAADIALFNSILVPLSNLVLGFKIDETADVATQKKQIKKMGRVVALPYIAEKLGMDYVGRWQLIMKKSFNARSTYAKSALTVEIVRQINEAVLEIGLQIRSLHFV